MPFDTQVRRFYPPSVSIRSSQWLEGTGYLNPNDLNFNGTLLAAGTGAWTSYIRCTGFNAFQLWWEGVPALGMECRVQHVEPGTFLTVYDGVLTPMPFFIFLFGGFATNATQNSFICFRLFIYNTDPLVDTVVTCRLWASVRR